ncbi:MAG: hypothetical protein KBT11_02525 [Treponema sp.]|nr:hypothetical protein [Candidatus Treponema equifaecale]
MSEEKIDERFSGIMAQSIVYIYKSVFKDFIYKQREMEPFYEQIAEMVPENKDFFVNWFKGFVAVASFDFVQAKELFLAGLSSVDFKSEYAPQFLQQGFALFMYDGDRETALKFWNCGVENKIFAFSADKLFAGSNAKEQFWIQFPPKMFVEEAKAQDRVISDYTKENLNDLQKAIEDCDFSKFKKLSETVDFDTCRIDDVTPLYYAIQKKGVVSGGVEKFTEKMVMFRTQQVLNSIDMSRLPMEARQEQYLSIVHQMRVTFELSGLARLIYIAGNGTEEEQKKKLSDIEKIIALCIEKTSAPDEFVKQIEGKMGANALHLAAEYDDEKTLTALLNKGCDAQKIIGHADFGMKYSDGSTVATSVPNSLVYRLISFKSWNCLKLYLSEFNGLVGKTMTEKSDKCNITPLVYFILNTIYTAMTEDDFNKNKELVDGFIPLFVNCGAVLDENTAFGTAKALLGMK